jgi:hypothetical protein
MDMGEINEMEIGPDVLNMPDQQPQQLKQSSSDKSNNNRHKEGECTSKMADGKLMQRFDNTIKRKNIIYMICFTVMSATFVWMWPKTRFALKKYYLK